MIACGFRYWVAPALIVALLSFCACSRAKEAQKENAMPVTQQATEAIRDFGKKPMDKARETQKLGDDRTRAIDEAVGTQNGR
jgi:hypothetical protein